MAILFLNNIQKKLFAEAFKVLDFATPILGVQKPAKPRSSNCGLPSSIRIPALEAFQLQDEDISPDLVLSPAAVAARGWGGHHEQPVDHNAPEAYKRNVPDDVISVSDGEIDQESSLGEESSYACDSSASEGKESSDSEPAMSEVSDQYSMLEHAYQSIQNVFSTTSEGKLVGGDGSSNQTGKSSGSLAISQAHAAVEVWCQST